MSIAERYLKEQFSSEEFRRSYLEEKMKLDIEYRLEDLKKAIQKRKSPDELIERVENLEKLVMGA
jgi:polyhydroxyalkanoate synthesis regulator phasin